MYRVLVCSAPGPGRRGVRRSTRVRLCGPLSVARAVRAAEMPPALTRRLRYAVVRQSFNHAQSTPQTSTGFRVPRRQHTAARVRDADGSSRRTVI